MPHYAEHAAPASVAFAAGMAYNRDNSTPGGVIMKKVLTILCLLLVLGFLAGCAPGANSLANTAGPQGTVAGFWQGLWNGIISPVTFVISLFNRNVQVYEVHNNGGWYNLGFLLGVVIIFGGGGASTRRSNR
jgi:hypothetical protein